MLQPDISVICHRDRIVKKGVYGAPDLCIEIVSPSSRKRDYEKKRMKYRKRPRALLMQKQRFQKKSAKMEW